MITIALCIFISRSVSLSVIAILECPEAVDGIKEGDVIEADPDNGVIYNRTTDASFTTKPFPPFIQKIISAGGLIEAIKNGDIA